MFNEMLIDLQNSMAARCMEQPMCQTAVWDVDTVISLMQHLIDMPSVLWCCWLGWVVGCWRGYLGWGADLHMAQQIPLPLTISCSSKSRLALPAWFLPFWYLLTRMVPDKFQKSSKLIVIVVVFGYQDFLTIAFKGLMAKEIACFRKTTDTSSRVNKTNKVSK